MRPFWSIRLLSFFIFCPVFLQAQYFFEKLTEENGLSDNRVTCFLKDKTGFLWIGTKNGLNRYDGSSFKVFRPSSHNSISNESINDIAQDSSGKLWVATTNGLNIYDPSTDRWEVIMPTTTDENKELPNNLIWDIEIDEHNQIWIVADVWELSRYDPSKKKFIHYNWPGVRQQKTFEKFPGYRSIHKMTRKSRNEWWLATTIGLCSVEINSGKFRVYEACAAGTIIDLFYDSSHQKVFFVSETGILYCYDEKNNLFNTIKPVSQAYPARYWEKTEQAKSHILLSHPAGMIEMDAITNTAILISHQPSLSPSLLPGGAYAVYRDNTGIVWIGTTNGINYFNSRNKSAEFISLTIASVNARDDGMSAAIYDTTEDKYYITSIDSKELFIIEENTGKISSIRTIDGTALSACTNICLDRKNNLWLLTETHVYKYDRGKQQFKLFPTPNAGRTVIFNEVLEDKQGNYWFATWRDGVYRYNTRKKEFYIFTSRDSISAKNITSLHNDPDDDAVWIGSYNYGPYRYDLVKKSFINYTETLGSPQYLQMSLIKDIEQDANGKLWFCSFGSGLWVFHNGQSYDRSFTSISFKNGLPGSSYYSIVLDNRQRLWLLGRQGLTAVDLQGKYLFDAVNHPATRFTNFAPGSAYIKRISFNRHKNEILVPVAGGLLIYHPDEIVPSPGFPVVLTGIAIDNKPVDHDPSFNTGERIEIPYRSNVLSFQFAALDYSSHGKFRYEYKLHDKDTSWKTDGATNSLNFTHLSPGHYNFSVRAWDSNGNLSANAAHFNFRILPPFWQTWWFISGVFLMFAYAIYRWINYYRVKIKAQQILNYFATSLYGQNTIEEVFWDIAKNCISQLGFMDCVVYLYDPKRKVLIQKAAYGPKNPQKHEINNALEIPLGNGIVGAVAQSKKAEIINNTSKDNRYILDDERRFSEITVPILVDNEIFGVIDSEHPKKRFFKKYHLRILSQIASICSDKVSKYIIQERLRSKISRDLHDEIGSSLTSINVLSKVALSKAGEQADIANYLSKIKETTSQTMENMGDMVWAINPKNDTLDAMMSRMKEFAVDLCEARGIELDFSLPAELEKLSIDLDKRRNLFLVFKEAVNNAVKYSFTRELMIRFEKNNGMLQMIIQDNGKGFATTAISSGNGLHNMQERARECGGNLHIESALQKGTRILFEIPSPDLG
jgi:signal transduction histidine kinase/ligand-binding sensor domain-containing protein